MGKLGAIIGRLEEEERRRCILRLSNLLRARVGEISRQKCPYCLSVLTPEKVMLVAIFGTPVATFPSSSNPNKSYTVKEDEQGNLSCDCPAWVFKKGDTRTCKHVEEAHLSRVRRFWLDQGLSSGQLGPQVETQARDCERGGSLEDLLKKLKG